MIEQAKDIFLGLVSDIKELQTSPYSDLYINISEDELVMKVYDDQEQLIHTGYVESLAEIKKEQSDFETILLKYLKEAAHLQEVKSAFEQLDLLYPFSVVYVDDRFVEIDEVLLLDDTVVVLHEDFINHLDQEIDDFLERLLKD